MAVDTIADMLTRIRNACTMKYDQVEVPASKTKEEILNILKQSGFIVDYHKNEDNSQGTLVIELKYKGRESVISGLKRISKPGLRVYAKAHEIPEVLNGLGIAVVSTSEGIITGREAKKKNLGGEVLLYVW